MEYNLPDSISRHMRNKKIKRSSRHGNSKGMFHQSDCILWWNGYGWKKREQYVCKKASETTSTAFEIVVSVNMEWMNYYKSWKLAGLAGSKHGNWCPEDSLVASKYHSTQRADTRTTNLTSPSVTCIIWLNAPSGDPWRVVHQEKSLTHCVAELQGPRETLDLGNMSCKVVHLACGNPLHQADGNWVAGKEPNCLQANRVLAVGETTCH